MTPLAYATPHSNAPLQELRPIRSSSLARKTSDPLGVAYATDELFDIEIYESESDESYLENDDDDEDDDNEEEEEEGEEEEEEKKASRHAVGYPRILDDMRHDVQHRQLPEDEPWPGIEDWPAACGEGNHGGQHASADDDDHHSNASSQPSEYPATQRAWPMHYDDETGFHIHEDQE